MSSLLDLDHLVLDHGAHNNPKDGACVMEAAAYIKGEPWSDHPACTSPVIGAFLRSWNDSLPDDDRQQLDRYLRCTVCDTIHAAGPLNTKDHEPEVALLNTAATDEVEVQRAWMATDWLVRVQTPAWLRLAGLTEQADLLANMGEVRADTCPSILPVLRAVQTDARAAWAAAGAAAGPAARDAARDAAGAAARDAARAAAGAAAWDAAWDAAGAAAWDAARDAARAAAGAAARAAAGAAAGPAARDAAGAAAWAALRPTAVALQTEAHLLVERMIDAERSGIDGTRVPASSA